VATLEALTKGARVRGIVLDTAVSVVDASWFGNSAIQLTYRVEETGTVAQRLLYRGDESTLLVAEEGATWAFDGDGSLYRLVLEAYRIRLAFPVYQREEGRFEITHVSAEVRRRDRQIGRGAPVLKRYERICFDKELIHLDGRPDAQFIAPGHPLLDTVISLVRERHTPLLRRGAVLVDDRDDDEASASGVRALFCVRHDIIDGRTVAGGEHQVVSSELHFVEIDEGGEARGTVQAPYLDYRPARPGEQAALDDLLGEWAGRFDETGALTYSIEQLVPPRLEGVRTYREELTLKTMAAVKDRLTREIAYWDHRAEELKELELAGKRPKLNSGNARQKADDLAARLKARMTALALERQIAPRPPVVVAGALVVPARSSCRRASWRRASRPRRTAPTRPIGRAWRSWPWRPSWPPRSAWATSGATYTGTTGATTSRAVTRRRTACA